MYVTNELDSYDTSNGALHERQTIDTLPPGVPENMVADIHVSPSGNRVYVSNRGHNSIAVFDVGADARLARIAVSACSGNWSRNFALAPGGRFMLVANQYSGEVSVLPVITGSDAIGAPIAHVAVAQASCVQFVQAND